MACLVFVLDACVRLSDSWGLEEQAKQVNRATNKQTPHFILASSPVYVNQKGQLWALCGKYLVFYVTMLISVENKFKSIRRTPHSRHKTTDYNSTVTEMHVHWKKWLPSVSGNADGVIRR